MSPAKLLRPLRSPIALSLLAGALAAAYLVSQGARSNAVPGSASGSGRCGTIEGKGQKIQCWDEALRTTLKEDGLAAAFELLEKFYAGNRDFAGSCHSFTHALGMAAYERFRSGAELTVTPAFSACSYGFYHGFMEALTSFTGDYAEARVFCDYIDRRFNAQTPNIKGECYHGIGHGVVNSHDPALWGDARGTTAQALTLCEKVSESEGQLSNCVSGVWNGIAEMHQKGENGLIPNERDPFWLCREEAARYKGYCYGFMARVLFDLVGEDLSQAVQRVEGDDIVERQYAPRVVLELALEKAKSELEREDFARDILFCYDLKDTWLLPCIEGYVNSLLQTGTPGVEYEAAFEVCRSLLRQEERDMCFAHVVSYTSRVYSPEKMEKVCAAIGDTHRGLCFDTVAL